MDRSSAGGGYSYVGIDTSSNQFSPVTVDNISTASQFSVGQYHTCARLSNGTVKCWGYGGYGNLGNGSTSNSKTPVVVSGITTAQQVAAGSDHSCAVLSDKTVKCWRRNNLKQLGDGTLTDRSTPVTVSGVTNASMVSVSTYNSTHYGFSCALLENGTVKCWGRKASGYLGDGTTAGQFSPVSVSSVSSASQEIVDSIPYICELYTYVSHMSTLIYF